MVVHAVLGVLSIYAAIGIGVGCGSHPGGCWGSLLAPAVSSVLWWRDAVSMLVIIYTGAVLAPFMVVAAVGQVVLLVLEGAVWLATGARAPAPVIGPTILARRQLARLAHGTDRGRIATRRETGPEIRRVGRIPSIVYAYAGSP